MGDIIRLLGDERGATAVEYALIATFVSIAAIFAMNALGVSLADMFVGLGKTLDDALAAVGLV
ncbi:MAG: Flp family type IVb pilin [Alphaproteobacteria bacterium]